MLGVLVPGVLQDLRSLRRRVHEGDRMTERNMQWPDGTTGPNFVAAGSATVTGTHRAICPDLLSIRDIGEADGWRGHLVRGVFRVLRVVTGL